jgi:hypothetical protein
MQRLEVSGAVRHVYIYIYVVRRQRVKHTYNALIRNHRLFKISQAYTIFWKPFPPQHPTPPYIMLTPPIQPPYSPFITQVSRCFPHSCFCNGLLFSRKFIAIVSAMSANPSLRNATPHRKCPSYDLDLNLDDVNLYKHKGDNATNLVSGNLMSVQCIA